MILYKTPSCPMCKMLAQRLEKNNLSFEIIDDVNTLIAKNITHVPVLEVDGQQMNLNEALQWLREYERHD